MYYSDGSRKVAKKRKRKVEDSVAENVKVDDHAPPVKSVPAQDNQLSLNVSNALFADYGSDSD